MAKQWEFFKNLHEPLYVADIDTHELIYMDKRAMEWYGFKSAEDYAGNKCYMRVPPVDTERRFIKFEPAKKLWQKAVSFAVGAILLIVAVLIIGKPIMSAPESLGQAGIYAAKAFQTFILFFFIIAVYPALMKLFAKLFRKKDKAAK